MHEALWKIIHRKFQNHKIIQKLTGLEIVSIISNCDLLLITQLISVILYIPKLTRKAVYVKDCFKYFFDSCIPKKIICTIHFTMSNTQHGYKARERFGIKIILTLLKQKRLEKVIIWKSFSSGKKICDPLNRPWLYSSKKTI